MHKWLCSLEPAEARTQFQCPSISAFNWAGIFYVEHMSARHGMCGNEPRACELESAFNGASLYPLELLREKRATYDGGPYGQLCEHVSFNRGLGGMVFDPAWQVCSPSPSPSPSP